MKRVVFSFISSIFLIVSVLNAYIAVAVTSSDEEIESGVVTCTPGD